MASDSEALPHEAIVVFMAGQPCTDEPLRVAVPSVPGAWETLLAFVRASAPADSRELRVALGQSGTEAELALIDYWSDLPAPDRRRVWCVVGPLAGTLMRFEDRPAVGFALLGASAAGSSNEQARSLLIAGHPDTWTLALDPGPTVDAGVWRARLWRIIRERWTIGLLDEPMQAAAQFSATFGGPTPPAPQGRVVSASTQPPTADGVNWLDVELHGSIRPTTGVDPGELADRGMHEGDTDDIGAASAKNEAKVLRGRAGRLFLARDSHDSHRQIIGERRLTAAELEQWAQGTSQRMADLAERGSRLVYFIGPVPQVIYPEDLPPGMAVDPSRPVRALLDRFAGMSPAPEVVYPLEALQAVRRLKEPFSKTDSHWNDLGSYLGYEALMARVGEGLPVRHVGRRQVSFQETCYLGDLGNKRRPQRADVFLRARLDNARARLVEDNRVRNHGRMAVYECPDAPPTTCMVFGDSWAYSLLLYLAETFRRVVFFHRVNVIDREPIAREHPDLVLMILTERFCTAIPNDAGAVPFRQIADRKTCAGDVMPATTPPWRRHQFLHSVALDRHLPDVAGFRLPPRDGAGGAAGATGI